MMYLYMKLKHFYCLCFPVGIAMLILLFVLFSCDGIFPAQTKPDVPQDHNLKVSGVLHKSGLFEPLDQISGCTTSTCHGNDLQGGVAVASGRRIVVSSCYQCHGALWEGGEGSEREEND
jgi:hypothetical protein